MTIMDSQPSESKSFELLDDRIRRWIWEQKWDSLRDVQEQAIPLILSRASDVILAAPTSAGKTEAAFFPILSYILANPGTSVQVLYVSPLKALINDQFGRLELLCERLDIPVHRWHGDVSQAAKRALKANPQGVLLITPESLESLFMSHGSHIRAVFASLSYVVVDELHAFLGSERGAQLRSLLCRLEDSLGGCIPRVGLSATLSDMKMVSQLLRPSSDRTATIVRSSSSSSGIMAQLRGHVAPATATAEQASDAPDTETARHIFQVTRGTHALVFANSKRETELYANALSELAESARLKNEIVVHHGNLSKEIRETSEQRLRDNEVPATCVCTSTLELGIDIGAVESVVQLGVAPSVASLRQRVGRSGRRGKPSKLRQYVEESEISATTPLIDTLRLQTVQAIAMIELLAADWCEPPDPVSFHFSTLVQQVLSVIVERGGVSIPRLYNLLCRRGPFTTVDEPQFIELLKCLKEREFIVQTNDGLLLLDRVGERLTSHYNFFAAFSTPEEFRLVADGKTIGSMPISVGIKIDDNLIFAGRKWMIVGVDEPAKIIQLAPGTGKRPPRFFGSCGRVHRVVREKMLDVYMGSGIPEFLDTGAQSLLHEGRVNFHLHQLDSRCIYDQGAETFMLHWSGDREAETIRFLLELRGVRVGVGGGYLSARAGPSEVKENLAAILQGPQPSEPELAGLVSNKALEKYDWALSDELLTMEYAARHLSVQHSLPVIEALLGGSRR